MYDVEVLALVERAGVRSVWELAELFGLEVIFLETKLIAEGASYDHEARAIFIQAGLTNAEKDAAMTRAMGYWVQATARPTSRAQSPSRDHH